MNVTAEKKESDLNDTEVAMIIIAVVLGVSLVISVIAYVFLIQRKKRYTANTALVEESSYIETGGDVPKGYMEQNQISTTQASRNNDPTVSTLELPNMNNNKDNQDL